MTDRDPWADVVVTDFGFRWGPMSVTRLAEEVQIRVTPRGRKLLVENRSCRRRVTP